MNRLINFITITSLLGLVASNTHYLLSAIDADNLKVLGYSSILILGVMGIILDDSFSSYFDSKSQGIVAIIASCFSSIFLFGSYRAFTLDQHLEGLILALCLGVFWVVLLAIYIRLLIGAKQK